MKKQEFISLNSQLTFRQRLIFLLNIENCAEKIGTASNGNEFIELLTNHKPDLILMDNNIPRIKALEIIRKALEKLPRLKIFAFTKFGDDEYIVSLLKIGVKEIILQSREIFELEKDIHSLLMVENYCINNQFINIINKLSVSKLQIPNDNKRITVRANKLYNKINLAIQ